jgi:enoyl-[acyl-carrier protein] reductase I
MLTAEKAANHFGKIDVLVHSIAFAGREELSKPYYATSRDGFRTAMDISVFSFVALTNAFLPILNPNASVMCLTYYGSVKVAPHYNVMGVAKAALESSTRYLAYDLGPQKIRVNAISAGPIRTLAAAGVGGFRDMYKHFADMSPVNVTIEDVGNSAVFLARTSPDITGEILYVIRLNGSVRTRGRREERVKNQGLMIEDLGGLAFQRRVRPFCFLR